MTFRTAALALSALLAFSAPVIAADPNPNDWDNVLAEARGQTVYFNAWGGAENINAYINWAGAQVEAAYGVKVEHVKLTETSDAVTRVLSEQAASINEGGAIDLIWINGENFASMKKQGLLLSAPWSTALPNYALADSEGKAVLTKDFTVPVDGLESPWGTAQLTFYYDSVDLPTPPTSVDALAEWIAANPGQFTYAAPPNFIGTTFIKQLAFGLLEDSSVLHAPADEVDFDAVTAPLWAWLDKVNPDLWRSGKVFAADTTQLKSLLSDREISIAMTFNPGEASSAVNEGLLSESTRSFVLDYGSIGNAHFVTIPFNANAKAGAMVFANFLMSAKAQARKADENVWGDPTVLAYGKLDADEKAAFDSLDQGPATLSAAELGNTINEPHVSWTALLEKEWQRRYGS